MVEDDEGVDGPGHLSAARGPGAGVSLSGSPQPGRPPGLGDPLVVSPPVCRWAPPWGICGAAPGYTHRRLSG